MRLTRPLADDARRLLTVAALVALAAPGTRAGAGPMIAPPPPALDLELRLDFYPAHGARTSVRGMVSVPVSEATRNAYGFYNLQLEGEVTVEGRTYDRFAYRFDVPASDSGLAPLSLSFERALRAGSFCLVLDVRDLQSGRRGRLERPLEVPRLPPTEPASAAANEPAEEQLAAGPALRLLPPPSVALGKLRFETVARRDVATVTFALDGRPVMTRTRPPYSVELDLGPRASRRRLGAEAFAADGRRLGGDEVELNTDGLGLVVRLHASAPPAQQAGLVTARAEVLAPGRQRVDRVELFLEDRQVAVLRRAPWEGDVALPSSDPALLRAVAYLADGSSAEDSVLVNAPNSDEVDVDLVELYAAVVDPRGRPVRGLPAREFRVLEEGVEQRLDRFAEVADLPLHVALVLDTSTSMTLRLAQVRQAALAFLRQLVRPQDEVMLVTFDDVPRVRVGFTHDLALLANGLEGLEARGGTALHDSLVFTLEQLQAVRGQRVLVLLSDGIDERSHAQARDVMELARRGAVTLYTIGLEGHSSQAPLIDRKLLAELAQESGGRSFFVDDAGGLDRVYAEIEHDVRSRYLLAYYSTHAGGRSFRPVDVEVAEPRLAARTIRGYYP